MVLLTAGCFICCIVSGLCFNQSAVEETTTLKPPDVMTALRGFIGNLLDGSSNTLTRKLLQADVSSTCTVGLLKLVRGLRALEPWALRLIDASGKYPTGLLQATSADLGAFDECVETVVNDAFGQERVRAQYCNIHIHVGNDISVLAGMVPAMQISHRRLWFDKEKEDGRKILEKEFSATRSQDLFVTQAVSLAIQMKEFQGYIADSRLPGIRLGICMVEDCSGEELQQLINTLTSRSFDIVVKNCVTSRTLPLTKLQKGVLSFLCVLVVVIAASTVIDICISLKKGKCYKRSILVKIATAFSLPGNTSLIFNVATDKRSDTYAYRFIHGMRFFSIVWIVLGHSYGSITDVYSRMVNNLDYFEKFPTLIVTAGYLSVDTFFFMSGFLLNYTILKQKKNPALICAVAIARRFIRATIPLFFMIMCIYLLPLVASGPDSRSFFAKFDREINNHWWALLLQVRNFRKEITFSILPHVWYLSADFQLFVVSLVVILIFRRSPIWSTFVFTLLSIIGCSVSAWQVVNTHLTPFLVAMSEDLSILVDTMNEYYALPFYHAVCCFSGCITFLLVERCRQFHMSMVVQVCMWCFALVCGFSCLFTKVLWYRSRIPTTEFGKVCFAFFDRILWSVCVAWITFACSTGRGGILNSFLSLKAFVPLARLSFGVYLIHSPFYLLMFHISRERIFFSHFTMVSLFFSVLVWSYLLSYLLFVLCEAPTGRLEKIVFMHDSFKESMKSSTTNGMNPQHPDASPIEKYPNIMLADNYMIHGKTSDLNSNEPLCCHL